MGHSLVSALLYGKLDGLDEETVFLFARTGLIHLFSASGFHLWAAILVASQVGRLFHPFLAPGRVRGSWELLLRLALMGFFGFATSWSSPMVRAFVFTSLLSLAELLELQPSRHWVFLLSLICSAVLGKGSTLSFVLSAAGMAGVLYIQPRKAWAVALGPALFTLPITIWCFGLFSPLSPLWNLSFGLAISWLVLPPAIVSLVLAQLGLPTAWLDWFAESAMERLTEGLRLSADTVGGALWVRPAPWLLLVFGSYLALFLWTKKRKRRAAGLVALLSVFTALAFPVPELAQLDVGQGDALLLRGEQGWTLSDAGPPGPHGLAPVCRSLEALGVGALEHVALSHFDLDHRGGLSSLLLRHVVRKALWFPESALRARGAPEVLLAAERSDLPVRFLSEKQAPPGWRCWLSPFSAGNEASPLCRASLPDGQRVLLTGDIGAAAEAWFVSALRPFPRAEILKVAHHGSRGSSSAEFLTASGAKLALVGVGRNRYGHPTQEALRRLESSGMSVRRTDLGGTLGVYPYLPDFTDEITRLGDAPSRVKPGSPAATRRLYVWPASVE